MISDAFEWKKEIEDYVKHFKDYILRESPNLKRPKINYDTDQSFITLERFFYNTAFVARKLMETNKLSPITLGNNIQVIQFNCTKSLSKSIDSVLKSVYFKQFYDLQNGIETTISPKRLCDLLIHSLILVEDQNLTGPFYPGSFRLKGFYVNSDDTRDRLYYIDLNTYFLFLEAIIKDRRS